MISTAYGTTWTVTFEAFEAVRLGVAAVGILEVTTLGGTYKHTLSTWAHRHLGCRTRLSLASSDAVGIWRGLRFPMGSNPAYVGGNLMIQYGSQCFAPAEYDATITDIYLTNYSTQGASLVFSDGTLAARWFEMSPVGILYKT